MADVTHLLRYARRRELAGAALNRAGLGLAIGSVLGIVALLVQRVFNIGMASQVLAAIPLAGALAGVVHAWATRKPPLQTAVNLDRSLSLKDRIGSLRALSGVRGLHVDGDFAALLQADAERLAASIDVRPATPIRVGGIWAFAALLSLMLALGIAFLPPWHWGSKTQAASPQEVAATLQPQARQVVQAI